MAIFEREIHKKVLIDDTDRLCFTIENWRDVDGHTEFVIRVHKETHPEQVWRVSKRYNDFHKLHQCLQQSGIPLELPPKKFIGNKDPGFIIERQKGLQKYLNAVLMNPILASSLPARSFVDPVNYCQPFGELALQHVSLALRGEFGWEVVCPSAEIGWRLRKHYYQIRSKTSPKTEFLGGWTDYGPDKYLDDKDMHSIFKCLVQLKHPYIYPIELSLCTDIGGLVVRTFHKNGTLRDMLCGATPQQSFMKKYGNPKGHKRLESNLVALYGRQMLEALKFLHCKGIPYGHLHTGNVIIIDERIKLLDMENGILGVPSFYRPYFMQHKKINNLESIDVYCFGHTLYEMVCGSPLHNSVTDEFPNCPPILREVLESILSSEGCKNGLPTIDSLLSHRYFSIVKPPAHSDDKIHFKVSNTVKEHLKTVKNQIEERLRDEQKTVRSQKRLVKVQEMMSSEEEKKKQRQKLKQERHLLRDQQRQKSKQENEVTNGHRCDSVNSSASLGTSTPPSASPVPPPPPPPPPQIAETPTVEKDSRQTEGGEERAALLGAICNFNKSSLRKTKVN